MGGKGSIAIAGISPPSHNYRRAAVRWSGMRGPVFRFVLLLVGAMVLFNGLFYLWITSSAPFRWYLELNASVSASLLRLFGESARSAGIGIASPLFSLQIRDGCDALQPIAFFVIAVMASPVSVSRTHRLIPVAVGMLALVTLNLVRIISLYYTGVYFPSAFEMMHLDVWQAAFIFLPLLFWLGWVRRAILTKGSMTDDRA